jgi:hypothetical protein
VSDVSHVILPDALFRKYPNADREWGWQYVFPASSRFLVRRTCATRRLPKQAEREIQAVLRLPGIERASIDRPKVAGYLLSGSHPVGRFKAVFFRTVGYSAEAWEVLAADLQRHAAQNEAEPTEATQYGQKYEVRGSLRTPTNRMIALVTVWIVLHGEDFPRFVTAFPGRQA